jgi:hypothetical protein
MNPSFLENKQRCSNAVNATWMPAAQSRLKVERPGTEAKPEAGIKALSHEAGVVGDSSGSSVLAVGLKTKPKRPQRIAR